MENSIEEKGAISEDVLAGYKLCTTVASSQQCQISALAQKRNVSKIHRHASSRATPPPLARGQVTWEWKGFTSSARADGLSLKHWVKVLPQCHIAPFPTPQSSPFLSLRPAPAPPLTPALSLPLPPPAARRGRRPPHPPRVERRRHWRRLRLCEVQQEGGHAPVQRRGVRALLQLRP